MSTELTILTNAQRMLAEAKTVPELKSARDVATAARAWVKSRGLGVESENEASEYILRAERRIGLELIRMKAAGERVHGGNWDSKLPVVILADIGVTNIDSFRWQQVARVPDDVFEKILAHNKAARERIAKVDFYRAAKALAHDATPEVPIDKGFDMFRAGVYHMLGWSVDKNGVGGPTRNDLLDMPFEDVKQIVGITQHLIAAITAYKTAKGIR